MSPSDGEGCGFDSRRVYQKTAICKSIALFFIYSAPTSNRRAALPSQRSGNVSRRKKQKLRSEIISGGSKPPPYIAILHAQRLTVFQIISRKGFLILTAKAPSHLDNGRQPTLSPKYRPRSNLIFCTTLQTFLTTEKSSPTDIAKASVSIFRVRPLSAICSSRSLFYFHTVLLLSLYSPQKKFSPRLGILYRGEKSLSIPVKNFYSSASSSSDWRFNILRQFINPYVSFTRKVIKHITIETYEISSTEASTHNTIKTTSLAA